MGRSTSLRVAGWGGTSPPHDQHRAEHRHARTIGFAIRMGAGVAAGSAVRHRTGVPRVTRGPPAETDRWLGGMVGRP